jgi:hypothetical protein
VACEFSQQVTTRYPRGQCETLLFSRVLNATLDLVVMLIEIGLTQTIASQDQFSSGDPIACPNSWQL